MTTPAIPEQPTNLPQSLASTGMSMSEKMQWADLMSQGDMVPQQYRGKPANVLFALEYAESVNVPAIHALTSISVVNGRPAPMTNLMVSLARKAGHEVFTDFDPKTMTATCTIVRRGETEPRSPIIWDEKKATTAGLWKNKGPWTNYPDQMLKWRAQSEAIRTHCVEVLAGVTESAEEARDRMVAESRQKVTAQRMDTKRGTTGLKAALAKKQQPEIEEPTVDVVAEFTQRFAQASTLEELEKVTPAQGELVKGSPEHAAVVDAYRQREAELTSFADYDEYGNPVGDGNA